MVVDDFFFEQVLFIMFKALIAGVTPIPKRARPKLIACRLETVRVKQKTNHATRFLINHKNALEFFLYCSKVSGPVLAFENIKRNNYSGVHLGEW